MTEYPDLKAQEIIKRRNELCGMYADEQDSFLIALGEKFDKLFQVLYNDCGLKTGHNFTGKICCLYCGYIEN